MTQTYAGRPKQAATPFPCDTQRKSSLHAPVTKEVPCKGTWMEVPLLPVCLEAKCLVLKPSPSLCVFLFSPSSCYHSGTQNEAVDSLRLSSPVSPLHGLATASTWLSTAAFLAF